MKELVTDNGPPFHSAELADFMVRNHIKHTHTPDYYPQSNGASKNPVGVFKDKIHKAVESGILLQLAIYRFLLDFRTAEHATTNKTPAALHLG